MISIRKLLKAIRKNCLECSGGVASEVADCSMKKCPLHPYRMGVGGIEKKMSRTPVYEEVNEEKNG